MKSLGWQDALWAVGVSSAAVAAFFIFRTPEPAQTALDLITLLCKPSPERAQALARNVAEPLELIFPPGDPMVGERSYSRQKLAAELAQLDAYFPGCAFNLEDWSIRAGDAGSAWVEGMLVYSDSQPSDLHGQRRSVRALFRESAGEQRVERVVLGRIERRLPEARP